jgi:hypothetical protein
MEWEWDDKGKSKVVRLPNSFKDGFSAMMRATYAISLLIHTLSS